jgi:hypothetical protein
LSSLGELWFALVPPALVLAGWVTLWMTGRPAGWKFYLSGAAVAVLCIPAGVLFALFRPCYHLDLGTWGCGYSEPAVIGAMGALLTAGCVVALLLLTAFLKLFDLGPGTGR